VGAGTQPVLDRRASSINPLTGKSYAMEAREKLVMLENKARSVPRLTSFGLALQRMAEDEAKSSEAMRPSAPSAADVGEA